MKKKSILIIDDNQETRAMYADIFRTEGYSVHTAMDGLEGVELAKKHTPNVVFTGIIMPRMDGFAAMEALAQYEETKEIPVIINSHLGRQEDRKRAEEYGVKDFIVRGMISPNEVVQRVNAILTEEKVVYIEPDLYAQDAEKLAHQFGLKDNTLQCPDGSKMTMRIVITNNDKRAGTVEFICSDE